MSIKISNRNIDIITVTTLFALLVIGSSFSNMNSSSLSNVYAQKQDQQQYSTNLTGNEEVPPTNIKSTGNAKFHVDSQSKSIVYSLRVIDLKGITEAHIHNGTKGVNGPVIVTLYRSMSPFSESNNSLAINGTITKDNLEGPLAGKQMNDLLGLMSNGSSYVNVHTEQNPLGAIRGQIMR